MGKFTITKGHDGQYYFNLKAGNGEIILQSEGYTTKSSCIDGIESVRLNSRYDIRYVRKIGNLVNHYFILIAANYATIGKSQLYSTRYAMEIGIRSVKTIAPLASLIDLTVVRF
jgi:uncharacterized protein YegP (UPF0339 family)